MFNYIQIYLIIFFVIIHNIITSKIDDKKCYYGVEYLIGLCFPYSFEVLPQVKIDESGIYKYIQIKCKDDYNEFLFIRGRKDCKYHKNIFAKFKNEVNNINLNYNKCTPLGGGRINKNIKKKTIKIYGYSKRYGRYENQHEISQKLIKNKYPDYKITWSNDGY